MAKIFLDTQILVYTLDQHDKSRQKRARAIPSAVTNRDAAVISTQVLQEFQVTSTVKLGVEPLTAKGLVHAFENMEAVCVDPYLIREAIDVSILNILSFWDALIVAAAASARCEALYSEDLNAGQIIRGVRIENPFARPWAGQE